MPHIRAAMSAALAVLGMLACLLVSGLLVALAILARVERRHEEAVGVRTEDRPTHEGTSGDIHLVVGFPASVALDDVLVGECRSVTPSDAAEVLAPLVARIDEASHGYAEFGVFHSIDVRPVDGTRFVYVHARTRKPLATFVDLASRARHRATLERLVAIAPLGIIEIEIGRAELTTDPARARPAAMR